jgi:DNA mismatch endonuclease (patch repair protein)
MGAKWRPAPVAREAWQAPAGLSRAARAAEQDDAAGGRDARAIFTDGGQSTLASVALRMPLPGRRVYAYLRWSADGRTNVR